MHAAPATARYALAPASSRQRGRFAANVIRAQQPQQQQGRLGAANGAARAGKRAALVAAALSAGALVQPQAIVQTAFGGGGNGLGGNGGGWGGDHGWSRYFGVQPALALKEEEEEDLFEDDDKSGRGPVAQGPAAASAEDEQTFLCESVKAVNLPTGPGIPTQVRVRIALSFSPERTEMIVWTTVWRRLRENNPEAVVVGRRSEP